MKNNTIPIVVVTDDNYAQHLGVMLTSLYETTQHKERIRVYTLTNSLSTANIKALEQITNSYGSSIDFLKVDSSIFSSFGVRNRMSHAAYYKLAIPGLFKDVADKVIFLDCDLIVSEDIADLWNTDVSNHALAAVKEPLFNRHEQLLMPSHASFFNSGIMVINIQAWHKSNVFERSMEFLTENSHKISLHDQDALNAVLYDHWTELHPRWNFISLFLQLNHEQLGWTEVLWNEVIHNPAIIHYSTTKPWYYLNDHPNKDKYYDYLELTPWRDYVPPDLMHALNLFNKPQIIVYGTGSGGERVHAKLRDHQVEITYYVDSDSAKWDGSFYGRPIHSPEALMSEDRHQVAIFIASYTYYDEIASQLTRMGFREGEHYIAGFGRR